MQLLLHCSFLFFTTSGIINTSIQDITKRTMFSLCHITLFTAGGCGIGSIKRFFLRLWQRRAMGTTCKSVIFTFSINGYWFALPAVCPPQELLRLQKSCLVYMRFRCRNMESLHSDMPTCIKTYWIIHVNRRGLTGCALQIELRLKARNKQVKQINPKGQKKSCRDTNSLKVAVK